MRSAICSIFLKWFSWPRSVDACQSLTLTHMTHKMLSLHGEISIEYPIFAWVEQGKGVLTVRYHDIVTSNLFLKVYLAYFRLCDISNTIHFLPCIIGYIDDNIIQCNLPNDTSTHTVLYITTKVSQAWQQFLRHRWDDCSLPKCLFTLASHGYLPSIEN